MKELDLSLYLVLDTSFLMEKDLEVFVQSVLRGGVSIVQLREKHIATRDFITLARQLKSMLTPLRIPLIINDRVDVALASGAEGLHIGQTDMEYKDARKILGPHSIIGVSVETLAQAQLVEQTDADYMAASPVFATPTKTDAPSPWRMEGFRRLRECVRKPLIAIGGVNASNALDLFEAGANGLAVVSAICASTDPEQAARDLKKQWRKKVGGDS